MNVDLFDVVVMDVEGIVNKIKNSKILKKKEKNLVLPEIENWLSKSQDRVNK